MPDPVGDCFPLARTTKVHRSARTGLNCFTEAPVPVCACGMYRLHWAVPLTTHRLAALLRAGPDVPVAAQHEDGTYQWLRLVELCQPSGDDTVAGPDFVALT